MCFYPERCNNNLRKMAKQGNFLVEERSYVYTDTEWSVFSQKQWWKGGGGEHSPFI